MKKLVENWPDLSPLFDEVSDSVLLLAPKGTIERANHAALELFATGEGQLIGRPASRLFYDEAEGAETLERIMSEIGEQGSAEGKARLVGKGEDPLSVTFRASPLCDGKGEPLGTLIVLHDQGGIQERDREIELLAKFPDENPNPVLRVSSDSVVRYANRGSWLLLAHWGIEVGEKLPEEWAAIVSRVLSCGEIEEIESEVAFKTFLLFVVPLVKMSYVNIYGLDVSRRRHVEEKLHLDAQVFENASEGIMITDTDARIIDVNHAFTVITGYSREEILGENAQILRSDRHDDAFYTSIWSSLRERRSWQGEIWDRRKNGEVYPKWLSISTVTDEHDTVIRYISLFSDITSIKATQEQLYLMAHYDSLTGVPNRRFFRDLLEQTLKEAKRNGELVAVMFVDLDGFKLINDNLGHAIGDHLLCAVAQRIKECVRGTDTVARMGGDEFTIILPNLKGTANATKIASKILGRIAEPIRVEERELIITSSIGIAIYPDDITDAESLLQSADTAMYRVKELGKNSFQFFSRDMNDRAREKLTLQTQLRRGLERHEFSSLFQPQVDAESGRIVAVEALARWHGGHSREVGPGRFIPLAEETGLIHSIGEEILAMTCRQGRQWLDEQLPSIRMAVNVSGHQIRRPDFVELIERVVNETGFPAALLELELTESVLIDDISETLHKLERLKSLGISLAIDDFGTRYSSLGYLRKFSIDRLKIDKSFVTLLPGDASGMEIASAITAMARSLKLEVIAEGVETGEQAEALRAMGCHYLQGYLVGKPMEAEEMRTRLLSEGRQH